MTGQKHNFAYRLDFHGSQFGKDPLFFSSTNPEIQVGYSSKPIRLLDLLKDYRHPWSLSHVFIDTEQYYLDTWPENY